MKNRLLPLGYTIQDGEIVINKVEARTVVRIFTDYINGSSLKTLVGILNQESIAFNENAAEWNKGRLYHILMERRYLGDNKFPQLIEQDMFYKANTLKNSKSQKRAKTSLEVEYIKGIARCGKCGKHLIRDTNSQKRAGWVCSNGCCFWFRPTDERLIKGILSIVHRVNLHPDLLSVYQDNLQYKKTPEIMRLNNEMIRLNEQSVPSFSVGKKLILQLANTKFNNCKEDKSVYTDFVLENVRRVADTGAVDIAFLKEAVVAVKIIRKDEIAVLFKNGSEISEKEDAQNECETCNEDRSESAIIQAHK